MRVLRQYYYLTKPGIVYGNTLAAIAGYCLAFRDGFSFLTLVAMTVGLALVIAASCVVNNIHDRSMDQKMKRTKKRALAHGDISVIHALWYALILLVSGSLILFWMTTGTALVLALSGFVLYAGVYTPLKPRTYHAALIGSVPGALPPMIGYSATNGVVDSMSIALFFMMIAWQMAHFYAIAMYRQAEYRAAKVPVITTVYSLQTVQYIVVAYIVVFVAASIAIGSAMSGSWVVAGGLGLLGVYGFVQAWRFRTLSREQWARRIFFWSLVVLPGFVVLSVLQLLQWLWL